MFEILKARVNCDECGKEILLETEKDFDAFEETWFAGLVDEYCPECSELPEIKAEIEEERRITAPLVADEIPEVEFAEFISEA